MVAGSHLSDRELSAFGVTRKKQNKGRSWYIVPCDVCGEPIATSTFNTDNIYKCESCKNEDVKTRNKIIEMVQWRNRELKGYEPNVSYESFHRFENAVKKFDGSYAKDIEKARKYTETFDSAPEVMACIELLHVGARVISHQKVGSYTVDFCLPDEKLVIEIDGGLYHTDAEKEYWRDGAIKEILGDGWEIKHVPAESVSRNHKFFGRCMEKLLDDRRFELRKRR